MNDETLNPAPIMEPVPTEAAPVVIPAEISPEAEVQQAA